MRGDGWGGRHAGGSLTLAHDAGSHALPVIPLTFLSSSKVTSVDLSAGSLLWVRCALRAPLCGPRFCLW